jgi:hypothetical protein
MESLLLFSQGLAIKLHPQAAEIHFNITSIKFGEWLLLFSPKSFSFPSNIKKPKD